MGKIKSAWEIALERTENIVVDEEKIRRNEIIGKIRRIAGSYLLEESPDTEKLVDTLKDYPAKDLKDALELTIINSLSLPMDTPSEDIYSRVGTLLSIATNNSSSALAIFEQISNLCKQYPLHRKQLLEQMKAQFEPMLRDKESQMKEQYGQDIHLSLETDKEFAQIVRQNMEKLEKQYQQTLDSGKAELRQILESIN